MPSYDVVIPARDEAETVAPVIAAARKARGVGKVLLVDDGSTDATAAVARAAGATVISTNGTGDKAQALAAGVKETSADTIVFFDADILHVEPGHFEALAEPVVEGHVKMCCGLVDYGRLRNPLFLRLPPITGLRAIRREIFEAIPGDKLNGFQIEIMINEVIARGHLPSAIRVLSGIDHRSKVEKQGWWRGARAHMSMTLELLACFRFVPLWTYRSYLNNLAILPSSRERDESRGPDSSRESELVTET